MATVLDLIRRAFTVMVNLSTLRHNTPLKIAEVLLVMLISASPVWSRGLSVSVKLSAAGASNTQDTAENHFRSYVTQSLGKFKSAIAVSNIAIGGSSANSTSQPENFASRIQQSYDATKSVNILSLQFGGGNPGDLTSDPASVVQFYNHLVRISRKWKALGRNTKVVVYTAWGMGCADPATVTNYAAANALILADKKNFDAVIDSAGASPALAPSTSCPSIAISADCNHLTQAGSALVVPAYVAAVNSVY